MQGDIGPVWLNLQYLFYKIYTFSGRSFGSLGGSPGSGGGSGGEIGLSGQAGALGGGLGAYDPVLAFRFARYGTGPIRYIAQYSPTLADFLLLMYQASYLLTFLLCALIAYLYIKHLKLLKDNAFVVTKSEPASVVPDKEKSDEWRKIVTLVDSENPNDWKIAVLNADKILEDVTVRLGIPGDTLGERLKAADPSAFTTLQDAWEAHKLRNQISHGGSEFLLTKRGARIAIDQFERVFREFGLL